MKVIPIGTNVVCNDIFEGTVIQISIKGNEHITYEVQQTREDSVISFWFHSYEITSKHRLRTIIELIIWHQLWGNC